MLVALGATCSSWEHTYYSHLAVHRRQEHRSRFKCKVRGCALFERDPQRAYQQIPVDPVDVHHLGNFWWDQLYFDVMLPMGLRSAALCCQRTTNVLTYIARNHGTAVENYLDDFMGAEVLEKAGDSF